jgi:hypothetical protein
MHLSSPVKSRIAQSVQRLGYGLDDRGSRVRFPAGAGIFLFTTASRTALGSTQPPTQWVPGALSLGVKRPGRETNHSPPSSVEVKNARSYTSTSLYIFIAWCLVKHRDNFNFISTLLPLLNWLCIKMSLTCRLLTKADGLMYSPKARWQLCVRQHVLGYVRTHVT